MRRFDLATAALLTASIAGIGGALAQSGVTFPLRRGAVENLSDPSYYEVLKRPRPDYDARGVRMGSFLVFPSVTSTLLFDDNVFATESATESDWLLKTEPELRVRSDWNSHSVDLRLSAENNLHRRFSSEDHTDFLGEFGGRLDILRNMNITGRLSYNQATEERGTFESFTVFDDPVKYDRLAGEGFFNAAFGRLFASVGARATSTEYDDAFVGLTEFDQDYRDGTVVEVIGRFGYELTNLTGVFVQASHNNREFRDDSYNSSGGRLVGGVAFEASRLVKGEAYAGYLLQDFDSPGFEDIATWTFGANLAWQPSPLLTISLLGKREADTSNFGGGGSVINNDAALRADYEFRPNIILSALGGVELDDYEGARKDLTLKVGGEARYLISRMFSIGLQASHAEFESNAVEDYRRNQIGISGRAQF